MKLVWIQFFGLMLLVFLGSGATTISFFFDTEGVAGNVFGATQLDQEVAGQPLDGQLCSTGESVSTMLYSGNAGSHPFTYTLEAESAAGALCGDVLAKLSNGSTTIYNGPLLALMTEDRPLAGASTEELLLELRFAPGASQIGMCQFDTVWNASQSGIGGFGDTERITHAVKGSPTGSGGGCTPPEPTVDFYIRKDISGVAEGYALRDFSYRIVGDGIDVIAPHDSFTPLPVGTYTIEELVPAGFVKADWRIGWYGQCEKGSAFTTTLVVEERHVERFGTLYCTADNQYRPVKREQSTNDDATRDESTVTEMELVGVTTPDESPRREPEDRRGGRDTTTDQRENRRGGGGGTQPGESVDAVGLLPPADTSEPTTSGVASETELTEPTETTDTEPPVESEERTPATQHQQETETGAKDEEVEEVEEIKETEMVQETPDELTAEPTPSANGLGDS